MPQRALRCAMVWICRSCLLSLLSAGSGFAGRQFHSSPLCADMDSGSIADIRITDIERSTCKRQGLPFFLRDPYGAGVAGRGWLFRSAADFGADSKHKTASVFLLTLHWALQAVALVKNPHWFFAIGFWSQITGFSLWEASCDYLGWATDIGEECRGTWSFCTWFKGRAVDAPNPAYMIDLWWFRLLISNSKWTCLADHGRSIFLCAEDWFLPCGIVSGTLRPKLAFPHRHPPPGEEYQLRGQHSSDVFGAAPNHSTLTLLGLYWVSTGSLQHFWNLVTCHVSAGSTGLTPWSRGV